MVAGGWLSTSAVLAMTGMMPDYWMHGVGAARLAAELRTDPQMCGLALYDTPYFLLPGRDRLAGDVPLFALYTTDPLAAGGLAAIAPKVSPAFNRILARRSLQPSLPSNFTPDACESVGGAEVCIFARNGGCDAGAATPFQINDVLARTDL